MAVIYLPENFNGILFLLRESDADKNHLGDEEQVAKGSQKWIYNIFHDSFTEKFDAYFNAASSESGKDRKDLMRSKRSAAKYRNRFCEMLEYIGMRKEDLPNAAYDNLYHKGGGPQKSENYKEYLENYNYEMFDHLLTQQLDDRACVIFACKDIFEKLCEILKINKCEKGLSYHKNVNTRCFHHTIGNKRITVYEIVHPSRSPRLQKVND